MLGSISELDLQTMLQCFSCVRDTVRSSLVGCTFAEVVHDGKEDSEQTGTGNGKEWMSDDPRNTSQA